MFILSTNANVTNKKLTITFDKSDGKSNAIYSVLSSKETKNADLKFWVLGCWALGTPQPQPQKCYVYHVMRTDENDNDGIDTSRGNTS